MRVWQKPDSHFVILRDQDSANCLSIKSKLIQLCTHSGKSHFLVRIACRELESFYLGDLKAVEQGLGLKNLQKKQENAKYRNPDSLANPAAELRSLTNNNYDKVSGSRAIAPFMDINSNRSPSFIALVSGIKKLLRHF